MADETRVVLIDDEQDFTELTGTLLSFHGYQVETINDAPEAMKRLENETYDVVVIDIMMPEIDGLTLMRKLRKSEAYSETPMVALSAKKLSDEERKFLLTNDIHFMQKPFESRRLVDLIGETLAG